MSLEKPGKTVRLEAPSPWQGEAIAGWSAFPFHALPWTSLLKKGESHDGIECVKASRSRRVLRLSAEYLSRAGIHSASPVYAKRYLVNNLRRRVGNLLAGSKAAREFALGHALLNEGVPTPVPLAYAAHSSRTRGEDASGHILPAASYLLTLEWPNQGSVRQWLRSNPAQGPQPGALLASFLAACHNRGFYHDDCSADHILIAPATRLESITIMERSGRPPSDYPFALIDIDNGRLFSSDVPERLRFLNLFQVLRSLSYRCFRAEFREAFLAEYLFYASPFANISMKRCKSAVEAIAHRKVGRSVLCA